LAFVPYKRKKKIMPERLTNETQQEQKNIPNSIKEFLIKYPNYGHPVPDVITPEIENRAIKNEHAVKKMQEEILPKLKTKVVNTGAGYKLASDYQRGEKPTENDLVSDVESLGVSQEEKDRVYKWKKDEVEAGQLTEEDFQYAYLLDVLLRKLDDLHHGSEE